MTNVTWSQLPGCIYCGAPNGGDNMKGQRVPICRSLQKMDAAGMRTDACKYIEHLRRMTEELDTAVMGLMSGAILGGTHLAAPMEFGGLARNHYEHFGEFLLDSSTPHGGGSCECGGDENVQCHEYATIGPQGCRVGWRRLELADGMWSRG